jgi:RNase adaptor protein for sRNA GlmZ degradation
VLGRRGPRTRKFEDVKAEVERRTTAEKRAQAERQLLQQLRSSAQIKIDDTTLALVQ